MRIHKLTSCLVKLLIICFRSSLHPQNASVESADSSELVSEVVMSAVGSSDGQQG
jgi:hypothetical protein